MSSRTAGVAVAVTARTGAETILRRRWMRRKAGRNSWPHSEMQWVLNRLSHWLAIGYGHRQPMVYHLTYANVLT